jgi:hypothetical protein
MYLLVWLVYRFACVNAIAQLVQAMSLLRAKIVWRKTCAYGLVSD